MFLMGIIILSVLLSTFKYPEDYLLLFIFCNLNSCDTSSVQVLQSLSVFAEDDLDLAVEELNDVSWAFQNLLYNDYVEYYLSIT